MIKNIILTPNYYYIITTTTIIIGNPYRIRLDDGTEVWGPDDDDKFVRKQSV